MNERVGASEVTGKELREGDGLTEKANEVRGEWEMTLATVVVVP